MAGDKASATAAAGEAAGVLWRVATDCDKAKLEVTKAGVMGPAVVMVQAALKGSEFTASATEVLLEHVCFQKYSCIHTA